MPIASLLTWMERKQSAMMQDRIGPNRAAILGWRGWGIPHFVADAVKMIMKEDFVPAKANKLSLHARAADGHHPGVRRLRDRAVRRRPRARTSCCRS